MSKNSWNFERRKEFIVVCVIYIVLVFAAFSDILRIEDTSLTFFRLSLPLAFLVLMLYPNWLKCFVGTISIYLLLNVVYNVVFYRYFRPELTLKVDRFLKYAIWYGCIIFLFILVGVIKSILKEDFEKQFFKFVLIIGLVLVCVTFINNLAPDFFGNLKTDNENNYGCYIAALCPFLLVGIADKKKWKIFFAFVISMAVLYLNDSKAALFGVLMQVGLLFCVNARTGTRHEFIIRRIGIPVVLVLMVTTVLIINPSMHGYPMRGIIEDPLSRILNDNPYPTYMSSTAYRTNTTIFVMEQLGVTKLFGVGAGNTGILLKISFPHLDPSYKQALSAESIDLHNAWLEFMLDFGIVGILLLFFVLWYAIKLYLGKTLLTQLEKVSILFIFSFPVWVISASGVYTQYYLFLVIAYLILANKKRSYI